MRGGRDPFFAEFSLCCGPTKTCRLRCVFQMFEAIHEAAYRNTLANSLYIRPHYIGVHDHEALEQFYKQHYIPSNMAVVALGTDVDELAFQIKQRWGWGQDVPQVREWRWRLLDNVAHADAIMRLFFYHTAVTEPLVCDLIVVEVSSPTAKKVPVQSYHSFLDQRS